MTRPLAILQTVFCFAKGDDEVANPHFEIKITKRSKRQSAVAGAAYQSGENLFSEYDQKHKDYRKKEGVVYTEIMQIGRASCRERGKSSGGAGAGKRKIERKRERHENANKLE